MKWIKYQINKPIESYLTKYFYTLTCTVTYWYCWGFFYPFHIKNKAREFTTLLRKCELWCFFISSIVLSIATRMTISVEHVRIVRGVLKLTWHVVVAEDFIVVDTPVALAMYWTKWRKKINIAALKFLGTRVSLLLFDWSIASLSFCQVDSSRHVHIPCCDLMWFDEFFQ